MTWRFASHCRAAVSGGDLVLLDLHRGDYSCIPRGGAVLAPDGGVFGAADVDLLAALRAEGLVVEGEVERPTSIAAPSWALGAAPGAPTWGQRWRLVRALVDLLVHFRGRSFPHLIGAAQRRPRPTAPAPRERLAFEVSAFFALLPWVPFQGVCLYRAYLLLRMLHHAGLDATWVFGVRTWPFEAHCWLQVEELALDDDLDHVAGYAPILAV